MAKRESLTAKQERFCQLYAETRRGWDSYRQAYDCSPEIQKGSLYSLAAKLLNDDRIASRIRELIREGTATAGVNVATIQQMFADIVRADPNELIGLRVGCCRYCHGDDFGYQWRVHEYTARLSEYDRMDPFDQKRKGFPEVAGGLDFDHTRDPHPECPVCKGEGVERVVPRDTRFLSPGAALLYGGVKAKKDGIEIILADRQKALENLARILGAFKDNVSVSGVLATAQAVINAPTAQDAARLYQEMCKAISTD